VYGEVVSSTSAAGAPIPTYAVRVGPATVREMLPTDMYSFRSVAARMPNGSSGGRSVSGGSAGAAAASGVRDGLDGDDVIASGGALVARDGPSSTTIGANGDVTEQHGAGSHGAASHGVSEREYLSAVSSLLTRAGLSLTADAREMMGRVRHHVIMSSCYRVSLARNTT
jgi:hypothetical protein